MHEHWLVGIFKNEKNIVIIHSHTHESESVKPFFDSYFLQRCKNNQFNVVHGYTLLSKILNEKISKNGGYYTGCSEPVFRCGNIESITIPFHLK